jgi:predicted nucleic acid-binding Zn ribbon protein
LTPSSPWRPDEGPRDPGLRIGDATKYFLRARGLETTVTLADILSGWEGIVGPVVAAHAKPRALHGPTLTIEVDEPAWATEIQFQSGVILAGMSDLLGARAPTALTVRVGRPVAEKRPGQSAARKPRSGPGNRP